MSAGGDTIELKRKMDQVTTMFLGEHWTPRETSAAKHKDPGWLSAGRTLCWIAAGLFVVLGLGISIEVWSGSRPNPPQGVIIWLATGTAVSFAAAVGIHVSIGQRRIIQKGDESNARILREVRDARPADAVELARMNAQLEVLPQLHGAVILERNVTVEQLNRMWLRMVEIELLVKANENQRQADVTQMRENGSKLFIAVDDRLDSIEESQTALMGLVNTAALTIGQSVEAAIRAEQTRANNLIEAVAIRLADQLVAERERIDVVMKVLVKFIEEQAEGGKPDAMDLELRGFIAGHLHQQEPPEA